VTKVSSWLDSSKHEGYLCLKAGDQIDFEHFFIIKDGLTFEVMKRNHNSLELKPVLYGGHYTKYRYSLIDSTRSCPEHVNLYSPTVSTSESLHLNIIDDTEICAIGLNNKGTWTPLSNAFKTTLSDELEQ
jgi:ubiquitin-protein ligase